MRTRVEWFALRRVTVTGFLAASIVLNVCELPVHGQSHVADSPIADHEPRGQGDAQASVCEGNVEKPSATPAAIPDPAGPPTQEHIAPPSPPAGSPQPPATSSWLDRLFLLQVAARL